VTATFSEAIQPASVAFVLRDSASVIVPGSVSYDSSTNTVTLHPSSELIASRTYTATVSGAVDLAGNSLTSPSVWSFSTGEPGFQESVVFSGLQSPTAFQFASDGRVFIAEKSGLIVVFSSLTASTPTVFADLRATVDSAGNRGLLGLALDPGFPAVPYVYVFYSYYAPTSGVANGRLSRLQASGDVMTGEEQVLIDDWYQQYPDQSVGNLAFGADGALYAVAGDGASSTFVDVGQTDSSSPDPPNEGGALRSQDLRTPADSVTLDGSIIRVDPATGEPVRPTTSMVVGAPTVDANGVKSYPVTSVYQDSQPQIVRV
jgi:glucose/arabinose dehydrogenase